jgi:hypothetical protein
MRGGKPVFSADSTKEWFKSFTDGYRVEGALHPMLELKLRPAEGYLRYVLQLQTPWGERIRRQLACAYSRLLHDVGRFPQYSMYGTFFDSASVDHGCLGAEIITEKFDWEGIPENSKITLYPQ